MPSTYAWMRRSASSVRLPRLTSTSPSVTAGDGSGFVSTAQGAGTAATIKSDGTQNVTRGDVLTVDVARTANGTVSSEAGDVVVLMVIRANQPE